MKTPHWSYFCKVEQCEDKFCLYWKHNNEKIKASEKTFRTQVVIWAIENEELIYKNALEELDKVILEE